MKNLERSRNKDNSVLIYTKIYKYSTDPSSTEIKPDSSDNVDRCAGHCHFAFYFDIYLSLIAILSKVVLSVALIISRRSRSFNVETCILPLSRIRPIENHAWITNGCSFVSRADNRDQSRYTDLGFLCSRAQSSVVQSQIPRAPLNSFACRNIVFSLITVSYLFVYSKKLELVRIIRASYFRSRIKHLLSLCWNF